ncbi:MULTISPECIES: hypothetical protein [Roseobacteraceae]
MHRTFISFIAGFAIILAVSSGQAQRSAAQADAQIADTEGFAPTGYTTHY